MAFTSEILVRQRGLMRLFEEVPSELVLQCIDTVHAQVLDAITDVSDTEPPISVIEGETELVLAETLRKLAVSREINQQPYKGPDFSLEDAGRNQRLLELADMEERRAWSRLRPYLKHKDPYPMQLQR